MLSHPPGLHTAGPVHRHGYGDYARHSSIPPRSSSAEIGAPVEGSMVMPWEFVARARTGEITMGPAASPSSAARARRVQRVYFKECTTVDAVAWVVMGKRHGPR